MKLTHRAAVFLITTTATAFSIGCGSDSAGTGGGAGTAGASGGSAGSSVAGATGDMPSATAGSGGSNSGDSGGSDGSDDSKTCAEFEACCNALSGTDKDACLGNLKASKVAGDAGCNAYYQFWKRDGKCP